MKSVIGDGALAKRFANYALQSKYILFADGIHDSDVLDANAISAESAAIQKLLASKSPDQIVVYFSICGIDEHAQNQSAFATHKLSVEQLIRTSGSPYRIFRLPHIIALNDIHNSLINKLVSSVRQGTPAPFDLNISVNVIDIDDVYSIVHHILEEDKCRNTILNIANPVSISVADLASAFETYFSKQEVPEQSAPANSNEIDIDIIRPVIELLDIDFGANYLADAINKYYRHLHKPAPLLSVVIPTYNQELGIEEFYRRTKDVLLQLHPRFEHELVFVNDFSKDNTYRKLEKIAKADPSVKVINFARNFGNQIAITAGIEYCKGDLAVIIDDDLQDPPEIILDFIAKWSKGYKVVYGLRPRRVGVNPVFKFIAKIYYRIIGSLSETKIPNDTGDFRLIDKAVIQQLRLMKEENRYYRGMVAWVGFPQTGYNYERDRRYAGVSNFTFKKYVNFALNGLTSFTDKPLYFSSLLGFFITLVSLLLAIILIISKIVDPGISIRGWTSLTLIVMFFGGIQLFSIGIIGVYISKIYREVKRRPLFIVQDLINIDADRPL